MSAASAQPPDNRRLFAEQEDAYPTRAFAPVNRGRMPNEPRTYCAAFVRRRRLPLTQQLGQLWALPREPRSVWLPPRQLARQSVQPEQWSAPRPVELLV